MYPRQRISSKELSRDGFESPLAQLAKQAAQNVSPSLMHSLSMIGLEFFMIAQGMSYAMPNPPAGADGRPAAATTPFDSQTKQYRPPLLINSFRDSFSTLSSRRSSSQTIMTVSPPEDGDVAFFSSGVTQRLSAADSVASQYSDDERSAMVETNPTAATPSHPVQISAEEVPKKGFVRLNGARMARTLDSDIDRSTTPTAEHGFTVPSRTSTPLASARNVNTITTQMQNAHIGLIPTPVVPIRSSSTNAGQFWDSSRYQPGPTSQIIPSLPTLTTVSSAPVLLRDMSFSSRKSMVGEMGEYEYEDENTGASISPPRASIRKGKSTEDLSPQRTERPPLTNRNSRMHYTRRPAPPPPVPPIPALYLSNGGKDPTSPSQRIDEGSHTPENETRRTPTSARRNGAVEPAPTSNSHTLSRRPTMHDTRRPSEHMHLTAEERRAKLAEDYLTKGIAAHNDSTGMYDLGESAYYFRKAAEGGSSGGCVMYGTLVSIA